MTSRLWKTGLYATLGLLASLSVAQAQFFPPQDGPPPESRYDRPYDDRGYRHRDENWRNDDNDRGAYEDRWERRRDRERRRASQSNVCLTSRGACELDYAAPSKTPCRCVIDGLQKRGAVR